VLRPLHVNDDNYWPAQDPPLVDIAAGGEKKEKDRIKWRKYWAVEGERLLWSEWARKYRASIDPKYLLELVDIYGVDLPEDDTTTAAAGDSTTLTGHDNNPPVDQIAWEKEWARHSDAVYARHFVDFFTKLQTDKCVYPLC
jgi:hypothetical protein